MTDARVWGSAEPSPTPSLSFETWLDPVFPWRTGVIVFAVIALAATVALVARALERRRQAPPK